jgi:hypothetical protein
MAALSTVPAVAGIKVRCVKIVERRPIERAGSFSVVGLFLKSVISATSGCENRVN